MEQFVDEIWKPCIVNPVYMVSNYGRVQTIDHKIWCKKNNSYSLRKGQVAYIKKVDKTVCGNKEKFNKDMAMKFNLKSINTIRWITKGVTNKYTNQDIVQTTNTKSSNENCSGKEITKAS